MSSKRSEEEWAILPDRLEGEPEESEPPKLLAKLDVASPDRGFLVERTTFEIVVAALVRIDVHVGLAVDEDLLAECRINGSVEAADWLDDGHVWHSCTER